MKRVVVVEDDDLLANVLKIALAGKGFEVETCRDGLCGIEKVKSFLPHIVILDVNLPVLSGFEVLKKIKSDKATSNIPVILLTGLSQDVNLKRGFALGADDYLRKPFSMEELLIRIDRLIGD
ncbi:MAG: response regulator [Caldisericum sp.]|jgi:DNA-binding response OmpR family regulator|nr:response regulator [Caldisericum sp.]